MPQTDFPRFYGGATMWEPTVLDDSFAKGLEIEQRLNKGELPVPSLFLDINLGDLIETPQTHLPSILALKGRELRSGLEIHSLLTPGPADVAFVLAQRSGLLSSVLYETGHYDHSTAVLVIDGMLECRGIFECQGFQFSQYANVGSMHLEIIPAKCEREIVVERGSMLLLGTPGESGEIVALDVDEFLEPFRMKPVSSSARSLFRGRNLEGHRVALHRHNRGEKIITNGSGMMSFAVHASNDTNPVAHDMFVLGRSVVVETELPKHTLDVVFA